MFARHRRVGAAMLALAAAGALAAAPAARAQVNPFGFSRSFKGMSQDDSKMLFDAADALNATDPLHVGDTKTWGNMATGDGGTVTVMRIFRSGGMACHTLRYDLHLKSRRSGRYTVDWCRTDSGWKIKS
ncbi:hypothetical protein [Acidisphaera rubrifaciens]|uniref:Surface antigen domain-containing protein n=1 Tax=Acidisphaera rubrifaciens HS-AP3 TaxID=1231350 RepID=A0A0D6P9W4_9PROT|nr:hypothetical protein [Acidisphaera rubrifaciens]GAN78560.1 hypothetical protein Asru_1134_02 [Acidisphaera rubrifaciens HS-AP3]